MILTPDKKIELLKNNDNSFLIACLCAEWCGICREYKSKFHELSEKMTEHYFYWIDVEENIDLINDEDITDFPTILIQNRRKIFFLGPVNTNINRLIKIIGNINLNDQNISTNIPNIWEKLEKN
ncbi:Thiol-disulfide isomerase [Candidatus Kinetoplastibacterium desouzaii TCC079E]|uniref:Thiol-disulfide isomerase n=1 Tax=Candidatus Kinetoplastidibacterium desouzai TCC079E TaxID=1208919 RepID=M1L2V4_9PROT|nr:thioredoxin family protein [Candidatus Kinetoplastibacterium desouzaii]AGF47083.1 Thiol-disulfide isomerase [Candidatus Kinetoplastibacterium desouzaii TCC079E]